MSKTITVRADDSLREILSQRARASGKTVSGLVREILEEALLDRPLRGRIGHLRGRLRLQGQPSDAWKARLREHNWRP